MSLLLFIKNEMLVNNRDIIKQLPDDLQDMIYSQLHKSYMKDVNIEIEQYEEKQKRENRRQVLFSRIGLLYKRLLRKIYIDKIEFLKGYHEYHLLERKIRHIFEEKRKPQQHLYNVIDLVLNETISADDI